jgi:hypothetical protein
MDRIYGGKVGEPTFRNVTLSDGMSGTLSIYGPLSAAYAGNYVISAYFVHSGGGPVGSGSGAVVNTNSFALR